MFYGSRKLRSFQLLEVYFSSVLGMLSTRLTEELFEANKEPIAI